MFERQIEETGLNSWPALQQMLFDGWLLRFARGYTKRANSVTPLYASTQPIAEKIAWCEHLYQEKQLPTTFRLLSFLAESDQLDQELARRGYHTLDPSLVYTLKLPTDLAVENPALRVLSQQDWLPIFDQWSERFTALRSVHRELLDQISFPLLYAALYQQDRPVACGLGVLERETLGLFDIVTDPGQRRKGYGTQVLKAILDWGSDRGARYASAQVVGANLTARALYTKLGFQDSYQYWYRQKPRE